METSFDFAVSAVSTWDKDVSARRPDVDSGSCLERCSFGGQHEWDSLSHMWVVEDVASADLTRLVGRPDSRRRAFAQRRCRKCHLELESFEDWQ